MKGPWQTVTSVAEHNKSATGNDRWTTNHNGSAVATGSFISPECHRHHGGYFFYIPLTLIPDSPRSPLLPVASFHVQKTIQLSSSSFSLHSSSLWSFLTRTPSSPTPTTLNVNLIPLKGAALRECVSCHSRSQSLAKTRQRRRARSGTNCCWRSLKVMSAYFHRLCTRGKCRGRVRQKVWGRVRRVYKSKGRKVEKSARKDILENVIGRSGHWWGR